MTIGAPPPRPSLSVLSQTQRFLRDPIPLIREAFEECGDVFTLRLLGLGNWTFMCSPEAVREMFHASPEQLDAGKIHYKMLGKLFGTDALFNLDGEPHRLRQRQLLPLLNGPEIGSLQRSIVRIGDEAVAGWPIGEPFPLLLKTHRLSLEVLMRALFGSEDDATLSRLTRMFMEFADGGLRSPLVHLPLLQIDLGRLSPWGKILRARQRTRDALGEIIKRRRRSTHSPQDLLDRLLLVQSTDGENLSDESLLDEILALLSAGHETTGAALCWIIERLLTHPTALERLLGELDDVVGREPLAMHHLRHLPYLDAVIQESHRSQGLGPVAAVRIAQRPFPVGPYVIPEGHVVAEALALLSQRADIYPAPERFEPERFLDQRPGHFEWTPFGGGHRQCIGKGLAELELACLTAVIVRRCRLRLTSTHNPPVRMGHLLVPRGGLEVILEQR